MGSPSAPPGGVKRIVSLVPSVTETIFELGAGDRLVGVSTYCDRPAEAAKLPRVGSYLTPSIETIIGLTPEVVIGVPTPGNRATVERLRELGVPVVIVPEGTLADAWTSIHTVGQWVGDEAGGEDLVRRTQADIEAVRQRARPLPKRRVLFVVGHEPLVAAASGMFIDELMTAAGGINVAASAPGPWPRLSLESVIESAPEVIIDGAMGSEAGADPTVYWSAYASVPAVRAGRVRAHPSWAMLRPGPRLGEAAREIFDLIHRDDRAAPAAAATARSDVAAPDAGATASAVADGEAADRGAP